jgi:hypothetical protein
MFIVSSVLPLFPAKRKRTQAENLYKQRDLLLIPIKESIRSSRDVLLGIYRENPRELGEWGFEVNSSVRKTKGDDDKTA